MSEVFETTATIEDATHLVLETPLHPAATGRVKVRVLLETETTEAASKPDYLSTLGAAYRAFPDMRHRSTAEWMEELRAGERD